MRIKLRKNQSTVPLDKIPEDVQFLELIGESITDLPSLAKYTQLKNLCLNCPQGSYIHDFPQHIEVLKLRGIPLAQETKRSIAKLGNIRILEMIDTKIENFPPDFFINHHQLETLTLKNNLLRDLPASIKTSQKLSRINLDYNKFERLPSVIYDLKSLNHISLDHNLFNEEEKNIIHQKLGIWF